MTQKQKAKVYDEALKVANKYKDTNIMFPSIQDKMFPELKESEGERIRNFISNELACLRATEGKGSDRYKELTNAIAWLEKCWEQKPVIEINIPFGAKDSELQEVTYYIPEGFHAEIEGNSVIIKKDEKEYNACDFCEDKYGCANPCPMKLVEKQKPTEEYNITGIKSRHAQGKLGEMIKNLKPVNEVLEQKPNDNAIKPKFKVGDWITNGACIIKITSVDDRYYWHDNDCVGGDIESIDKEYHLWAIQDAKDGDVLSWDNGRYTIIFKELKDNKIIAHCSYNNHSKHFGTQGNYDTTFDSDLKFIPGTKEQRDLLFKKMKEKGYEWDAEHKQLKKIEQKHTPKHKIGDTIYYNSFGEVKSMIVANVTIGGTDNPMYEDKNGNAVFEKDLVEPKFKVGDTVKDPYGGLYHITEIIDDSYKTNDGRFILLKNQEVYTLSNFTAWSEEDERMIDAIISDLERHGGKENSCYSAEINYLKYLKERVYHQNNSITNEELDQAKKDAYNDALDKIEYHSGEPTFDDGWDAAMWYLKKRNIQPCHNGRRIRCETDGQIF